MRLMASYLVGVQHWATARIDSVELRVSPPIASRKDPTWFSMAAAPGKPKTKPLSSLAAQLLQLTGGPGVMRARQRWQAYLLERSH